MEGKEGTGETDTESGLISDWAELTDECLVNILSRLTFEHRWTGPMLVCKPWLNACKDPTLNSVFDLETRFDSSAESPRWWTPEFERKIDSMLRSVISWSNGNLTKILTRHCSDLSLNFAAQRYLIYDFVYCFPFFPKFPSLIFQFLCQVSKSPSSFYKKLSSRDRCLDCSSSVSLSEP